MRVAVITPYYKEDINTLTRCISSVNKQVLYGSEIKHYLVADGFPYNDMDGYPSLTHLSIPQCGDHGDTPRGVGAAIASAQGCEAILFLDADCWYEPDHIQTMVSKLSTEEPQVVTCPRNLFTVSGEFIGVDIESEGKEFNDTNCFLFNRNSFFLLNSWLFKVKGWSVIGDRVLWKLIQIYMPNVVRSLKPTINYTTRLEMHYQQHGKTMSCP